MPKARKHDPKTRLQSETFTKTTCNQTLSPKTLTLNERNKQKAAKRQPKANPDREIKVFRLSTIQLVRGSAPTTHLYDSQQIHKQIVPT